MIYYPNDLCSCDNRIIHEEILRTTEVEYYRNKENVGHEDKNAKSILYRNVFV